MTAKGSAKSTNGIVVQGTILAMASLIVRLIGFFYRVPLTRKLGVEGMGYYAGAFDIYSFLLIISTYAFPAALSKIISSRIAENKYKEAHDIFKAALLLAAVIGLVTSSLMFFQAENIARFIVKQEASAASLKVLAPAILIFSFLAVFRGYFQGMNTMVPTAMSQIIEQIINAGASLFFGFMLYKQSVEMGAAGGNLGAAFGGFFGLAFLVVVYFMAKPRLMKRVRADRVSEESSEVIFDYWSVILMTVVPMLLGSTVYNLSSLVDTVLFQRALIFHGMSSELAGAEYGILTSKYRLILTLPISIATALGTASIPSISESFVKKEFMIIRSKSQIAIKVVLMIAIPAACGLAFLAEPILLMLFGPQELEISAFILRIGAVTVVSFSISAISIAILQGISQIRIPMKNAMVAVVVKIIMTVVLLYVFNLGLIGAVVNSIAFSFIVATLNFIQLQKYVGLKIDYKETFGIPAIAGIIMGVMAFLIHLMMMSVVPSNILATLVAIVIALVVYICSLMWLGGLTQEVMSAMPMGGKLVRIARRMKVIK